MYQITYYVPQSHLELTKEAIFAAGGGTIGNYQKCAWQTLGQGQFMPLQGSDPHIGQINHVENVAEYKVEMIVSHEVIKAVLAALFESHPYEEPAYTVMALAEIDSTS